MTGVLYARYGPPSREYSTLSTPDSASVAVRVTVALVMYASFEFLDPATAAELTGAVVSLAGGSTTVNATDFSAARFPALSVAR